MEGEGGQYGAVENENQSRAAGQELVGLSPLMGITQKNNKKFLSLVNLPGTNNKFQFILSQ